MLFGDVVQFSCRPHTSRIFAQFHVRIPELVSLSTRHANSRPSYRPTVKEKPFFDQQERRSRANTGRTSIYRRHCGQVYMSATKKRVRHIHSASCGFAPSNLSNPILCGTWVGAVPGVACKSLLRCRKYHVFFMMSTSREYLWRYIHNTGRFFFSFPAGTNRRFPLHLHGLVAISVERSYVRHVGVALEAST